VTEAARCKDCKRKALPGRRRCKRCAKVHSEREAARKEARRRAGECVYCGAPAVVGDDGNPKTLCKVHEEFYEARRVAKKRAGKKKTKRRRRAAEVSA
jgi:hypothetical protein